MRRWVIATVATLAAVAVTGTIIVTGAGGARSAALTDRPLFAALAGSAEVPAGDRDGRGAASVLITGSKVCFGIQVNGVDRPIAAHIHQGRARANGPIVVGLAAPRVGTNGAVTGCVNSTATIRNAIKRSPSGSYVNVHTRAFPNGAIRGQLKS